MNELNSVEIVLSIIFTWVIGLLPPILIRFVFLKRPIAKWPAIGISSFFWFCNMILFIALGSKSKTHAVLWLIAWISYLILRRENKTSSSTFSKDRTDATPMPASSLESAVTHNHETSTEASLSELKSLYEKGLVTNEVYQERQKEILHAK